MTKIKSTGKSPYKTGHASDRGRGWLLKATVVVLLIGVGAWIVSFTRSVELQQPGNGVTVDPGAMQTKGATTSK